MTLDIFQANTGKARVVEPTLLKLTNRSIPEKNHHVTMGDVAGGWCVVRRTGERSKRIFEWTMIKTAIGDWLISMATVVYVFSCVSVCFCVYVIHGCPMTKEINRNE